MLPAIKSQLMSKFTLTKPHLISSRKVPSEASEAKSLFMESDQGFWR